MSGQTDVTGRERPELATRLLDALRTELGEPALEFLEEPTELHGGFDTRIFAFRLDAGVAAFSCPLVLRLLAPHHEPARALREQAIQNWVARQDYPAPRVLLASGDAALLGGGWLVMERIAGLPLLRAQLHNLSRVLVALHRRLHALDAEAFLRALDEAGVGARALGVDALLAQLEARIADRRLPGLASALTWLIARRPPERRRVICHGDLHPQNILMSAGVVTAVLDWPNTIVAAPEYDVAATSVILRLTPVELTGVPPRLHWLIRILRRVMASRYLHGYQRAQRLDARVLAYYEALACMRGLVRSVEGRLRAAVGPPNPLDTSSFAEILARRFTQITGVAPTVAPARPLA